MDSESKVKALLPSLDAKYNIFRMPGKLRLPIVEVPREIDFIFKNNLKAFPGITEIEERYLYLMNKLSKTTMLPPKGHLEILQLLLYVEQFYIEEDLKSHRIESCLLKPRDPKKTEFEIFVPDLDIDDPFVSPGDFIILDKNNHLRITDIDNGKVIVKHKDATWWYTENQTYSVSFKLNHYSLRCCHYAIKHMMKCKMNAIILHPDSMTRPPKVMHERFWFNLNVKKNMEQNQAVENIVNKTAKPAPYILFGPPGTGKTATLVEAIMQIYFSDPSNRVLICTPSNTAADEITKRLMKTIPVKDLLRFYSPSRDIKMIDKDILPCTNSISGEGLIIPKEIIMTKNIIISTLMTSMRLLGLGLNTNHFSYIFIDEAGQASEPETLIPFALLGTDFRHQIQTQFVLAGDPLQLGPVVKSRYVGHLLGMSMLERLMKLEPYLKNNDNQYNPDYITKLVKNFRNHGSILKIPNELFYNNELVACGGPGISLAEDWEHLSNKKFPVLFHAVDGVEYKEEGSYSTYNLREIETILHYLEKLTAGNKAFDLKDIGVVTPFKLQEKRIKDRLKKRKMPDVNVGTVQIFQGQEKDVIIMSTVRSRLLHNNSGAHVGFLSNTKRFNVSLTRAKSLLIVVGNPNVLKYDKTWKKFLTYCVENDACSGEKFSLHESIDERRKLVKPPSTIPNQTICVKENDKNVINLRVPRPKMFISDNCKPIVDSNSKEEAMKILFDRFKNMVLDCC